MRFKTIVEAEKSIADVQRIVETNYVPHTKTTVTGNVIKFMPFETTPGVQRLYEHYASQAESSVGKTGSANMLAGLLTRPGRP